MDKQIPDTKEYTTSLREQKLAIAFCGLVLGTGGAIASSSVSTSDVSTYQVAKAQTSTIEVRAGVPKKDKPTDRFRADYKEFTNTYGLNIKQSAELMGVTRKVVYGWLDDTKSLSRIKKGAPARLTQLSKGLAAIKDDRKVNLGSWLSHSIDKEAQEIRVLLCSSDFVAEALYEHIPMINTALRSDKDRQSLDDILGIS